MSDLWRHRSQKDDSRLCIHSRGLVLMTDHYFENDLINLHYYKFGSGDRIMLCFHGYGMHGKQFKLLETTLGEQYTFIGFDLFFHKETKLKDQSLETVKKGLSKAAFIELIEEFCTSQNIDHFDVIGYSMGTHFASIVAEVLADRMGKLVLAAPSSLNPGRLIPFFSKNKTGNKILEIVALSNNTLPGMLKWFKRLRLIDDEGYKILHGEIGTPELRFNMYASFTYLRFFEPDEPKLAKVLNDQNIKTLFIFGKRDKAFPPDIGKNFIAQLDNAEVVILDEGHEMIKRDFVNMVTNFLS